MKKILLVSKFAQDKNVYTYASSFYTALQDLGYTVATFNCKQSFLPLTNHDHDALAPHLKLANNILVNNELKRKICTYKPDIIFLIKAENVAYKTLRTIKKTTQCKLINFYPDNPFVFWNGNSNKNVLMALPLYDHFLIWSKELMPILQAAGCRDVYYFPFAYDQAIFEREIIIPEEGQNEYASDVCFIGTWDTERERYLTDLRLAMPDLNIAIWGNEWDKRLVPRSPLRSCLRGKAIYKNQMLKAFYSSKIILNFIRKQNMSAHNMRTFEVLASNAFLLTQRTYEQTTDPFQEGGSLECFATPFELRKKIAIYLKNDTLRKKVAAAGLRAIQDFTILKKLKEFFAYCQIREKGEHEGEQKTKDCDFINSQSL